LNPERKPDPILDQPKNKSRNTRKTHQEIETNRRPTRTINFSTKNPVGQSSNNRPTYYCSNGRQDQGREREQQQHGRGRTIEAGRGERNKSRRAHAREYI
jgi:hypothetical protein